MPKLFDLTDLSTSVLPADQLVLVDVSDPTGDANGTTKKVSIQNAVDSVLFNGIPDSNGNEQLSFTPVASAVNEVTISNAATGNAPAISATGGDTNVGLSIAAKGTGEVSLASPMNLADNKLARAILLDYAEETNIIGAIGGGTQDIDLTLGNAVTGTVDTSTTTFTFSNPTATGNLCGFLFLVTNGGSQTINWPASVDWVGGTPPALTTAGVDALVFLTVDGGTIWYGYVVGLDSQ